MCKNIKSETGQHESNVEVKREDFASKPEVAPVDDHSYTPFKIMKRKRADKSALKTLGRRHNQTGKRQVHRRTLKQSIENSFEISPPQSKERVRRVKSIQENRLTN